jgi:hypothetical protein
MRATTIRVLKAVEENDAAMDDGSALIAPWLCLDFFGNADSQPWAL